MTNAKATTPVELPSAPIGVEYFYSEQDSTIYGKEIESGRFFVAYILRQGVWLQAAASLVVEPNLLQELMEIAN